jgi:hypothetical protein
MRGKSQRGQSLIDFVLVGVPAIFISLFTFELALAMWQYHTLASVAQQSTRYVAQHGYSCTQNGNTCSITMGNIATFIENRALGLDRSKLNVRLSATSGDTTCNPITTCDGGSATYPSGSTDGSINSDITITATYAVTNPFLMLWPGAISGSIPGTLTLRGASRQRITF